jgi:hypothetical protein
MALLLLALAGCDAGEAVPTPLPSYAPSAPTLPATGVVYPVVPPVDRNSQDAFVGVNDPTAAALPSGGELPPIPVQGVAAAGSRQTVQLTAQDGARLMADLYMQTDGLARPAALLLAADRTTWRDLPPLLEAAGFAVLAVDVRENAPIGDYQTMIDSLVSLSTVDASLVLVIGAQRGADLALDACASSQPCDALALLSPQNASQPAVFAYNPRPLLLAVGTDSDDFLTTEQLRAVGQNVTYFAVDGDAAGTALLAADPDLTRNLLEWVDALR